MGIIVSVEIGNIGIMVNIKLGNIGIIEQSPRPTRIKIRTLFQYQKCTTACTVINDFIAEGRFVNIS
jgi:hypothetical protein